MGGFNSGRQPTKHPGPVEHVISIDMRVLRRLRLLRAGECLIGTLRWSNRSLSVAEARVRVDLSDLDAATLTITVRVADRLLHERIGVEAIPCRFGGHRFYFVCPDIGRRCEVLYFLDGRFASRQSHSLGYAVQGMDELARLRHRQKKLRDRLDGNGLSPRPRGTKRYVLAKRLQQTTERERALWAERLRSFLKLETGEDQISGAGPR